MRSLYLVSVFMFLLMYHLTTGRVCWIDEDNSYENANLSPSLRNGSNITWKINNTDAILYSCTCTLENGGCGCQTEKFHSTTVTPIFSGSSSGPYRSYLRFATVGRELEGASVVCVVDENVYIVCDSVEIYVRPDDLDCSDPEVNEEITEVVVTCRTNRTYPEADMYIYYNAYDGYGSFSGNFNSNFSTCEHEQVSTEPVYYTSQCVVTIPTDTIFFAGRIDLNVRMYPVLSNPGVRYTAYATLHVFIGEVPAPTEPPSDLPTGIGIGIGIMLGIIVIVVVVVVIAVVIYRKRHKRSPTPNTTTSKRYADLQHSSNNAGLAYEVPNAVTLPPTRKTAQETKTDKPKVKAKPTPLTTQTNTTPPQDDALDSTTGESFYEEMHVGDVDDPEQIYINE